MSDEFPFEQTRRSLLRAGAGVLGLGAVGSASAHPGADGGKGRDGGIDGPGGIPFGLDDGNPFENASAVGYHSLGDVGPAGRAGQRTQRHGGDRNAEVRVHGDIAVTSFRASGTEDAGRRMAVLDISEFNDASTQAELEEAELSVLSILRNYSAGGATDIKLSDDGNYAFIGGQDLGQASNNSRLNKTDLFGNVEATGGVVAIDISDPTRPRTVATLDATFSTGVHNLFHHRIDGTDYVFACKDLGFLSVDSGLYVVRFDRDPGNLTVVNRWTADGNTARGGVGTQHGLSYVHDVEIQDDPRNGRPTAYLADWDRGLRVLDLSEPTDIRHIGQFDMFQSHFAAPFPELIETADGQRKRVAIASHEEPDERFDQRDDTVFNTPHRDKTNPNSTGTVFLIDCDGVYPDDPGDDTRAPGDGPKQLGELDNWTWKNVDTDDAIGYEDIEQETFSYQLSPHNSQPAVHRVGGNTRYIIHQGHYHGGVRYLEIEPGEKDGLTGDARRDYRPAPNPNVEDREGEEEIGWINNGTDWDIVDNGHARPENEETGNLSPDFWSSVEHNGVTYSGDRSAGVFVTKFNPVKLRAPRPPLEVSRSDDGTLFTAGRTNQVDITVETFERRNTDAASVTVRDRIPAGAEVVGTDDSTEVAATYPQGVRTAVEFETEVQPGDTTTFTYFVDVGDEPGGGTYGPVEVSNDGAEWAAVGGTTDTNENAGVGGL